MKGMTIVVKSITDLVKIFIFIFGVYIILFGDASPGGGFAGGVILASMYVLLMLAFGGKQAERELPPSVALKIACCGVFSFVSMAISGLFFGKKGFFHNYIYQKWLADENVEISFIEAGTIALAEIEIGLLVGALVFLVIFNILIFRPDIG